MNNQLIQSGFFTKFSVLLWPKTPWLLIDLQMPEMDGIETTAALRRVVPQSAVVILSIHDDAQTRGRAQATGAVAFVEKRGSTDSLLAAIRQAARHALLSLKEKEYRHVTGTRDRTHAHDDQSRS